MPRPSPSSPPTLDSVDESPSTPRYVTGDDDDGNEDDDEDANGETFFVAIEHDGLSIYSCRAPKKLIADPKSLALALELLTLNESNYLSVEQRTRLSKVAIEEATRKGAACTMDIISPEEIKDLIDNPPASETGTSAFHKFAPSE